MSFSLKFKGVEPELNPSFSLKTHLRDMYGRKFLVRTFVGERVLKLLPAFEAQVAAFVRRVREEGTGFTEEQMRGSARGPHFFSILGHDRNSKKVGRIQFSHQETVFNGDLVAARSLSLAPKESGSRR